MNCNIVSLVRKRLPPAQTSNQTAVALMAGSYSSLYLFIRISKARLNKIEFQNEILNLFLSFELFRVVWRFKISVWPYSVSIPFLVSFRAFRLNWSPDI